MSRLHLRRRLALFGALVATLSCSGDPSGPGRGDVAAIRLIPPVSNLALGGTLALQATVLDADGNELVGRRIFFTTENGTVATVSDNGVVTARAMGTTRIAASAEGKSALSTITVVQQPVATVTVLPTTAQTSVGNSVQLSAATYDAQGALLPGRAVLWSSSNASVATVDETGLVRGRGLGSATITATSEGKSGGATVNVSLVPVGSVSLSPPTASLVVGQQTQLTATVRDPSGNELLGRDVTWSSSVPTVASVSQTGLVSALASGSAVITASVEGRSATSVVDVAPTPAAAVIVSPGAVSIVTGQTRQLTATVTDAQGNPLQGRPVSWSTSDGTVATVNSNGLVTALVPGTATITATSEGKSGTSTITVTPPVVSSVSLSPAAASIGTGQTQQLTPTLRDALGNAIPTQGRTLVWTSNDTQVASVSSTGLVSGKKPGSATITLTVDGVSGTSAITVTAGPAASVAVSSGNGQSAPAGSVLPDSLVVHVTDAQGHPVSGAQVTWSVTSGNGSVTPTSTITDAFGAARARWTLGSSSGTQGARASVSGAGSADFTATATAVQQTIAKVEISPGSWNPRPLQTRQFTARAYDASDREITNLTFTWSSSDNGIVTVTQNGFAIAIARGDATITASAGGRSATARVTVR